MLKQLRRKRRKLENRLKRRQAIRQRLRKIIKWAKKRNLNTLAEQTQRVEDRLEHSCKQLGSEIRILNQQIQDVEERRENEREDFVRWLLSQVGVAEGSELQRRWAADLGYSWTLPWCSIFAGYGLKHYGGFEGRLPVNPAYSGNWLTWAHGERVSYSNVQPGDLLIFDWGDGGITDHVAVYTGDGKKVGGNENDRVEHDPVPTANVVGVVRPNWKE